MNTEASIETVSAGGPYALDLLPPGLEGCGRGAWRWAIRRHGKVYQRSDRGYPNADKCRADGLGMIERIRSGVDAW